MTSGPVSVEVGVDPTGPEPDVTPDDEGAQTLTVWILDEPTLLTALTGSVVRNLDGTLTIVDEAGTPIGGLTLPTAGAGRGYFAVQADGSATLSVAALPTTDATEGNAVPVTTVVGSTGLRSATWGRHDGGRSLAVDPTSWARAAGVAGADTAWAELVAAVPEADTPAVHDQFRCHALGAKEKETWNLEPWRPDVGLAATIAARCNPG